MNIMSCGRQAMNCYFQLQVRNAPSFGHHSPTVRTIMHRNCHRISSIWCGRGYSSNVKVKQSQSSAYVDEMLKTSNYHIEDLCCYTRGKWLINDHAKQRARYLDFNFDALCAKVLEHSPGAERITHLQKQEGSHNRAFTFLLDSGKRLVVRVPTAVAGPKQLTTNSEVATIAFLQRTTDIPIPRILDWNDDSDNPVGCEFILMEHAPGVELRKIWFDLDIQVQMSCIEAIMKQVKMMSHLELPAYGSIYYKDFVTSLSIDHISVDGDFCIGPHCGRMYWDCTPGEQRYTKSNYNYQGPWQDLSAYTSSLIEAGKSRLPTTLEEEDKDRYARRPFQGSAANHRELLNIASEILQTVINTPSLKQNSLPTLLHPDLHMSNIFVDPDEPTKITSIIDWQSSSIEPACHTLFPLLDFAIPPYYLTRFEEREAEGKATERQYWDATMHVYMQADSRLAPLLDIDDDILAPFHRCHRTWRDGLPALARDLDVLLSRWESLSLPGDAPSKTSIIARLKHFQKDLDLYADAGKLKHGLEQRLGVEHGWVPIELWDATQEQHKLAYERMMGITKEPDSDMTPEQMKAIWPYDLPC